jgi:MFS family permease
MNRLAPSAPECAFQLSRTIGSAFRTGPRGLLRREGVFHRRSSLSKTLKPLPQIAPAKYRGTMGALNQLAGCSGILVALLLSLPLRSSPGWWRTMFWIACVPAAMLAGGMAVAAESPRWLYKRGRYVVSLPSFQLERAFGSESLSPNFRSPCSHGLLAEGREG